MYTEHINKETMHCFELQISSNGAFGICHLIMVITPSLELTKYSLILSSYCKPIYFETMMITKGKGARGTKSG